MQKADGLMTLGRHEVILDGELSAGDKVELFYLPDGKVMLTKAEEGSSCPKIARISAAYVYFDTEINVIEA